YRMQNIQCRISKVDVLFPSALDIPCSIFKIYFDETCGPYHSPLTKLTAGQVRKVHSLQLTAHHVGALLADVLEFAVKGAISLIVGERRLTKDGTIYGFNDFQQGDCGRRPRQSIAAIGPLDRHEHAGRNEGFEDF